MDYGSRESTSGYTPLPARRSDTQGSYRNMSAEIEQVVTKLLRTTKSLLEALNSWSQLRMSTAEIFELHGTLERQFYKVSQSFEDAQVKTNDLSWIPHQLRQSVVECMEQEPSTTALDQYLPRIRDVIVHLLHGLKGKQQQLRELDMQMSSGQVPTPSSPPQQHQYQQPGTALSQRDSYRSQEHWQQRSNSSHLSYSDSTGSNKSGRGYYPQQQDRTSPNMMSVNAGSERLTQSDYDPYTGGMPRPNAPADSRKFYNQAATTTPSSPPPPQHSLYRKSSNGTASSSSPVQQPIPSRSASRTLPTTAAGGPPSPPPPPPPPPPVAAPSPSRYLHPTKNNNDFDESDPHTASALAALKRQENLARRSSVRRASMYRGNTSADYASKRYLSDAPPVPSLANPSGASTGLDRVDENNNNEFGGPVTSSPSSSDQTVDNGTKTSDATSPKTATPEKPSSLTLYLQMDQQTKKVSYSGEITLPALSMLFIERFGYNAGQQDFPSIYIRDPSLPGVSYELQDMADVIDKSILSLTLNDKKEDKSKDWMESLTKEWNETRRTMLEQMDRLEHKINDHDTEALVKQVVRETLATAPLPKESTGQETLDIEETEDMPKDVPPAVEINPDDTVPPPPPPPPPAAAENIQVQDTKLQQEQRDEIEKLQRQLMVLRQAQTEQQDEHAKTVQILEEQNKKLQETVDGKTAQEDPLATVKTNPSQARHYIEQGKEELLNSSDKITTRLEDLQDAIDHLKLDVTQRKCRPSEAQMDHCREERKALADEIEGFGDYITKVKPIWKKTWEQELQTIVKEQQTLKEQEGLLLDMKDDLEALQEVFENLEKICVFQEKARHQVREFRVAPPEDGFEGMSSVLKQVATIDVDHSRRLKALDMADRMRQRELANRTDDFEKELSTFVGNKKLKKTGGAMEIDRLRQEKDKEILQNLYKEKQGSAPKDDEEEVPDDPTLEDGPSD